VNGGGPPGGGPPCPSSYFWYSEVAALLRVLRSTVDELTRSRRLPFVKVGRRTLFVRVDPDASIVANRVTPRTYEAARIAAASSVTPARIAGSDSAA
jgi:excisionase family DNA binding protein